MNNITRIVNQAIAEQANADPEFKRMLNVAFPRSPSYRYMTREGSKDRYFWTTEKINHKGSPRYVAGVYRYLKVKKVFKLVKQSGFARKYKAVDRAKKWCDEEAVRKA